MQQLRPDTDFPQPVFETGSVQGDYSIIAIFPDGPSQIEQVTYWRSQTTEYGKS
jgi:hypothetical protein